MNNKFYNQTIWQMAKFAFWLNDNSATKDALKILYRKICAWEKLNLVWRGPELFLVSGPGQLLNGPDGKC